MKIILLAAALTLGLFGAADARGSHGFSHSYSSHSHSRSYGEGDLQTHNHYTNVSGHRVHSPSRTISGGRPRGASAHCSDGSWSFSEHRRGTCSHHGGIG